jgi:uncharacterized alkaline shock family protein YloU
MNDERGSVDEVRETSPRTTSTRRNGRGSVKVLDDAVSEIAKMGAEGVDGVRVLSAKVEEQAAVRLTVDVDYGKSLSDLVEEVRGKAKENVAQHLPGRKNTRVYVTVASVSRPRGTLRDRVRGHWDEIVTFLQKELGPWIVPLLVLSFGVFILWAITRFVNETDTTVGDVVLVLLLVLPILIYAIVSGKLTELKGPGGVEAKFTAIATTPVAHTASHDSVSIDELLTVSADTGRKQLGQRVQRFTEVQPIVMTITLGAESYKTGNEDDHLRSLRTYVAQLSRSRNFALVAFLDASNNFVAYMPSWVVKNRLDDKDRAKELFSVIKDDNHKKLLDYPGAVRDKIAPDFSNGEALSTMVKSNLDVIVVVDENNRLKGVVQREQVLTRMVLALTPTK